MKKKTLLLFTVFALAIAVFIPVSADAKVKISKKSITMTVGQKSKLKVKGTKKKVTWKSKKKSVATVNKKGKVTAKAPGKTKIIAKVGKKKYKCKVTVKATSSTPATPEQPTPTTPQAGTRNNPINLRNGHTFTYSDYKGSHTVKLQLLGVTDPADSIIAEENMFNTVPDGSNRWILYHYKLDYLSGTDEIYASDVINTYYFYNSDITASIGEQLETAAFSGTRNGLSTYDVRLYPGGTSDVWLGILVDKGISYTNFKIDWYDSSFNTHEIWFRN